MSAVITSGSFKGNKQELQQRVVLAVSNGAFQGMIQAIAIVNPTLAQRTGQFRSVFSQVALQEIQSQMGQDRIRVNVDDIANKMIQRLSYAKYHIDGKPHHPGDTSAYRDPSTSGTKPLNTQELERVAVREMKKAINNNLKAQGIDYLAQP